MIEATDQIALGVSRSAAGQVWKFRPSDDRLVLAMCQRHTIPDILARVLVARGVALEEVAAAMCFPSLSIRFKSPRDTAS